MPYGTGSYGEVPYGGGLPSAHGLFGFATDSFSLSDSARSSRKSAAVTDSFSLVDALHASHTSVRATDLLHFTDGVISSNKVGRSIDTLILSDVVKYTSTASLAAAVVNTTIMSVSPVGYDGLQITWTPPAGQWNEQILLRSAFGTPLSIFAGDGTVLLDEPTAVISQIYDSPTRTYDSPTNTYDGGLPIIPSTTFLDTGLRPGHFYYYSLLVFNQTLGEYVLAGAVQGLVITYYGFGQTYQSWMPDWYLEQDLTLPGNPLESFLALHGYEMDWLRSEIESLFLFTNINLISGALIPALGANYGMSYEPELGMTRSRVLVGNAVFLYKNRGTTVGIEAAASGFSGYGCTVTPGKNLEIQLDDAAFDSGFSPAINEFRHWVAHNATSIIKAVPANVVGVTPQHANYDPVPILVPQLTSSLIGGIAYSTLAVTELQQGVNVGDSIQLVSNGHSQTFVATSGAPTGSFAIQVGTALANYSYPVGTTVQDLQGELVTAGYLPVNNENVGQFGSNGGIVHFSTCTPATATTLGIPIPQTNTPTYVLSQYFQNDSQATPTLRSFEMQIDWYNQNGAFLSSVIGNPVTEVSGQWVQAYVVGVPPAGAFYFGRTFKSTTTLAGDLHLCDGEQVEINTQATPGPTSWQPPRDIQINLFPVRQNLLINPVGRSGTTGWVISNNATMFSSSNPLIPWPAETSTGFLIESETVSVEGLLGFAEFGAIIPGMAWFGGGAVMGGVESATPQAGSITLMSTVAVNPGLPYSLSVYMMAATTPRTIQLSVAYYDANGNLVSPTVFASTLSAPLVAGTTYTQLPISPLPFAVNAQESIVINVGGLTSQQVQTSQPSQIGTTELPVGSFIANGDYPAGTVIVFSYITFEDTLGGFTRGSNINQVTPLGAVKATIQITIINPAPFEIHYIGAPLFEPLPSLLPYFDANFLPVGDYLWEGTPNESISDYYPGLPSKLSRLVTVLEDYTPIGSTFSLVTGAAALAAVGEVG